MAKYTFKQFQAEYPNDAACLAKLMEINYGGTEIVCPGCAKRTTFHPMHKRRAFACQDCGYHVYPGRRYDLSQVAHEPHQVVLRDVPHDQHAPRRGRQRARAPARRHLQVRLAHVPRTPQADGICRRQVGGGPTRKGHVEIDETFVGGRRKANEPDNKTVVFGMLQRDGTIVAGADP